MKILVNNIFFTTSKSMLLDLNNFQQLLGISDQSRCKREKILAITVITNLKIV